MACASTFSRSLLHPALRGTPAAFSARSVHLSAPLHKTVAGKYKKTRFKTRPVNYEQAFSPSFIGRFKGFNSWNTSNLEDVKTDEAAELTWTDFFIRRFVEGTWHDLFVSEIIIKRRFNVIYVQGVVQRTVPARKMYFLAGYTEELLSQFLKCPVKIELQTVNSKDDVVYKYV